MQVGQADGTVEDEIVLAGSSAKTTQTHNAVSIALSGSSLGTNVWIDTNGYGTVAITMMNDNGTTNSGANLQWSNDGAAVHGIDTILASAPNQYKSASTPTKARYLRVQLLNNDAAAAHTMSAWVYLKV